PAAASRGEPFTVAIIDIALPGVSGIELARKIKADPAIAGLRLVMLTSHDHEMNEIGDLRAHVVGCLNRPVRQSALRASLVATEGAIDPPGAPPRTWGAAEPGLLVEDNPGNLGVAVGILGSFGWVVGVARDGQEGVECCAR